MGIKYNLLGQLCVDSAGVLVKVTEYGIQV